VSSWMPWAGRHRQRARPWRRPSGWSRMGGHFGWEEGEHPGLLEEHIGGESGRSRAFPSLARGLDFSK
jgi:hypothetical protein